jgi:hypothetical protein
MIKRFFAMIFRISSGAVDLGAERILDTAANCGCPLSDSLRITASLSVPLFIRRRRCGHAHAKAHGIIRNGWTYCTACERMVPVTSAMPLPARAMLPPRPSKV